MTDGPNVPDDAQLEGFREQARALGFTSEHADEVELESADAFIARMKAQDAAAANTSPSTPASTRRRWLVTGTIAAAAAAIAVAVVLRPTGTPVIADTPPVLDFEFSSAVRIAYAPGEEPRTVLDVLTQAAKDTPTSSGSGPVQHHVTDNWYSDQDDAGNSLITPRVTETWLEPDGSLVSKDATGPQLTSDGRGIPTDGPAYASTPTIDELPAGTIDADFAETLSRRPAELRQQLLEHAGCESRTTPSSERSYCLYTEVRGLFSTYTVDSKLAAAVWQMLRDEEGFTSLGSVEDRAGRNGVGISLIPDERPQYRFILIASSQTGQLLGAEEVLIRQDPDLAVRPPAVISFSTIVTADRISTTPEPR